MLHPFEYLSYLEELGYKPKSRPYSLPPPPILYKIFDDVDDADGFFGLYRGVFPSLIERLVHYRLAQIAAFEGMKLAGIDMPEIKEPPDIIVDGEPVVEDYIKVVRRKLILSAVGAIISYPFYVVSLRMMSAFIGKEPHYQTMFGTFKWIIQEEGFAALYQGMVTKIFKEWVRACVTGVLIYYVNKHLVKTKDGRIYAYPIMSIAGHYLARALIGATTCMVTSCCDKQVDISPELGRLTTKENRTAEPQADSPDQSPQTAGSPWATFGVPPELIPIVLIIITHPLEYVKVLMQLGHEPLPVRDTTTLLGHPARIRPNIFQYLAHIYRTEGILGCFRGLSANLAGILMTLKVSPILITKGIEAAGKPEFMAAPDLHTDGEAKYEDYFKNIRRDILIHLANLLVSYPFIVVSTRMMAAYIGNDAGYLTMPEAFVSTLLDSGPWGFYNGFIPRLLSDLYCMVTSSLCAFLVNKYVFTTKEMRQFTELLVGLATLPITGFLLPDYPLKLSSTCVAISGSSLKAGNPPLMPVYSTWIDCLIDLYKTSQHRRGGAAFFRYVYDEK
ncbi:mitochondrial carrier protein domain-containing protein [Phthorimaea operculella]|nr:mitochondrial carrier protein domain-containing protein [Phthorimaea operculella]